LLEGWVKIDGEEVGRGQRAPIWVRVVSGTMWRVVMMVVAGVDGEDVGRGEDDGEDECPAGDGGADVGEGHECRYGEHVFGRVIRARRGRVVTRRRRGREERQ